MKIFLFIVTTAFIFSTPWICDYIDEKLFRPKRVEKARAELLKITGLTPEQYLETISTTDMKLRSEAIIKYGLENS